MRESHTSGVFFIGLCPLDVLKQSPKALHFGRHDRTLGVPGAGGDGHSARNAYRVSTLDLFTLVILDADTLFGESSGQFLELIGIRSYGEGCIDFSPFRAALGTKHQRAGRRAGRHDGRRSDVPGHAFQFSVVLCVADFINGFAGQRSVSTP